MHGSASKARRYVGSTIALWVLLTIAPANVSAQVLYGSLVGNVTEETNAVVPGARVTIVNTGTNLTRQVVTNETGAYSFSNLVSGTYMMTVEMDGFTSFVADNIVVAQNSTVRRDVVLRVAGDLVGGHRHRQGPSRSASDGSR